MKTGGEQLAISIQEPWLSCILFKDKRVENRTWSTNVRGRVLLHASSRRDWDGAAYLKEKGRGVDAFVPLGHIVGAVEIVDCVTRSDSWWFRGPHGFVLANPVAFKMPVKYSGKLGFFKVPESIVQQLERGGYQ